MNRTLPRIVVVFAMMAAWFFASNHCALVALTAAVDEHACCHRTDPAPVSETMTGCCQALNAPLPAVAAAPAGQLHVLFPAWLESREMPAIDEIPVLVQFPTHGPPGVVAFAELVLNRCLLAHAPPVVVA